MGTMKSAGVPGAGRIERLPEKDEQALRDALAGDLVTPGDDEYDDARQVWNGMIDKYPAAIARCTGTADVVAAVEFARDHDLFPAVRGGGHNVAGNATCDGGLVIDLSEMNGVHVDLHDQTARAEGGATLGDVDRETQLHGLATTLGVVSQTGIGGLTLSGGMGHLRREYGLACDNVRSADVVTADGEVRTASADADSDLLWALKGGGGNFGVVTSLEYDLHPVGPEVFALFVWYHGDDGVEVLRGFRDWAADAPREASVLPFTAHVPDIEEFPEDAWGEPAVVFLGCYDGTEDDATETFDSLRELADPIVDLSAEMAYTELQQMLDEDYPDGMHYYWKSVFLTDLTDEVIDQLIDHGLASPSKLSTVDIWQLGGAIADPDQDDTPFWHRDKPYLLNYEANWEDPTDDDENVTWVREGIEKARELAVAGGQYGNFPGFNEDPAQMLFGDNYDRLTELKTRYDPDNLFRRNQNITPQQ